MGTGSGFLLAAFAVCALCVPDAKAASEASARPQSWCADGTIPDPAPGKSAMMSLPGRPSGSLCTVAFLLPLAALSETGDAVALHLVVSGQEGARAGARFVAIEALDAAGRNVLPRVFAYPWKIDGKLEFRAVVPLQASRPWTHVRVLASAQDGESLEIRTLHASRVEFAASPLAGDARTVFELFRNRALAGPKALAWQEAERRLELLAQGADDGPETVLATARNLKSMLDMKHTVALTGETYAQASCPEPLITEVEGGELAVAVGPFMAMGDEPCQRRYAEISARRIAQALETPGLHGARLDLGTNSGGNMWPMLYALRPFLNEGPLLGFSGKETRWVELRRGALLEAGMQVFPDLGVPYERTELPVTVYICGDTASSGEALAIALKSSGAVLAGEPSAGFTTSNETVDLPHGVKLLLTTAAMVSPEGQAYARVLPDRGDGSRCR